MSGKFRFLIIGLYSWLIAVMFGAILIDMIYAKSLSGVLGLSKSAMAFSDVSDFLLFFDFIIAIIGVGAIAVTWRSTMARNLFISSLLIFSLEFLIPFLSFIFKNMGEIPGIRFVPTGVASILAFIGLYTYRRQ